MARELLNVISSGMCVGCGACQASASDLVSVEPNPAERANHARLSQRARGPRRIPFDHGAAREAVPRPRRKNVCARSGSVRAGALTSERRQARTAIPAGSSMDVATSMDRATLRASFGERMGSAGQP